MIIDVALLPDLLPAIESAGKAVVAVDILRATSTMVTAFEKGAQTIHPVTTLEEAQALASQIPDRVLIGEVSSLKPEGFDFDNSPLALHQAERLSEKPLIMRTTNGTKLLKLFQGSGIAQVYIGSFLNLEALSNALLTQNTYILICCAGDSGQFSLEDAGFAGALIQSLQANQEHPFELTDAALAALSIWNHADRDVLTLFQQSSHGKVLIQMGIKPDLDFIAHTTFQTVPLFCTQTGQIIALPHAKTRGCFVS
jgi:2-phosphosulfolactate phosphatase